MFKFIIAVIVICTANVANAHIDANGHDSIGMSPLIDPSASAIVTCIGGFMPMVLYFEHQVLTVKTGPGITRIRYLKKDIDDLHPEGIVAILANCRVVVLSE